MTHLRTQIREAIVSIVKTGLPGEKVFSSRVRRYKQIPGIQVYTGDEVTDQEGRNRTGSNRRYNRYVTVEIALLFDSTVTEQAEVDAKALEIEKLLAADLQLGGLAHDVVYLGTEDELESLEVNPLIVATLNYQVFYRAYANAPETAV